MAADPYSEPRSRRRYLAAGAILFLALFLNNAPTPLYPIWQAEYGLGTAATTTIHSAYPVGTIIGLLFGGKLADQLGRRIIMFAAAIFGIAGALMMIFYDTLLPLLLARLVNGLATGLFSGPVTAALVELEPKADNARASGATAIITTISAASGTFAATLIITRAPSVDAALTVPFILQAALYGVAAILVLGLPETLPNAWRRSLRETDFLPRSVSVSSAIQGEFILAACATFAVWTLTGLWLGLGSALVVSVLGDGSLFHGGAAAAVMLASGGAIQLSTPRIKDRDSIRWGMYATLLALMVIAAFILSGAVEMLYLSTVLAGIGQGLSWLGAARLVNRIASSGQRAGTVSALYVVVYAGVTSIFLVGLVAAVIGLQSAVLLLLALLGLLTMATLLGARW